MQKLSEPAPKLYDFGGDLSKAWYIGFRMNNPKNLLERKPFQIRGYINYEKTAGARRQAAKEVLRTVKEALLAGWDPFLQSVEDFLTSKPTEIPAESMGLIAAIKAAMKEKELSHSSRLNYDNHIKFAEEAARKVGLKTKPINEFTRADAKSLLKQIKKDRDWSNKAYNKALDILGSIFSEIEEWELIEYNPFHKIKRLPVAEPEPRRLFTPSERKIIKDHLIKNHITFYVYVMHIYHSGIRPKEVLGLQISDLNRDNKSYRVRPENEKAKTRSFRDVPINEYLWRLIEKMDLWRFPSSYYIFSENFFPGARLLHRNTASRWWKEIVKEKLKIPADLYSLKHQGADDKILAGIDLDALRELYGHKSAMMTERYTKKVKDIYKKQILGKSPDF